jgi:hypothetical protein
MTLSFYSTKDVKKMLAIKSTKTLKKYRDVHGFPNPIRSGNGQTDRYSATEVNAWFEKVLSESAA